MTRKDYKILADVIWGVGKYLKLSDSDKDVIINQFAKALKLDNPRFDPNKFEKACK